jgi:hypothetical protein
VSETLPEPKKFSELTEEEKLVVGAIYTGSVADRMNYRFIVQRDYHDEYVTEWLIWTCSQFGNTLPCWKPFCVDTVEDHGTHYRTRGDGRHDRWITVVKSPTAASNPTDHPASP